MNVKILEVSGLNYALHGLGLNKKLTSDYETWDEVPFEIKQKLVNISVKLQDMDGGHNKFLESIVVWMDIKAPLYWWKQFDTYRTGITKQSESTMHTLMKRPIVQEDFEDEIPVELLGLLNKLRDDGKFEELNNILPSGYLQRRMVCTNFKTLRNMRMQRKNHKLKQWREFCEILKGVLR